MRSRVDDPADAKQPAGLLAEITADLASGSEIPALLERFLHTIVPMVGASAGLVRVREDQPMRMQLVGQTGLPPSLLAAEQEISRECGICKLALTADAPVWAEGAANCGLQGCAGSDGRPLRQALAVPLQHRGQVLGVYTLLFDQPCDLDPQRTSLLKAVGELLGLALHNARLERAQLAASLAQERQWMAAEVHDGVAQSLTFVKMRLPLLHDAIAAGDQANGLQYLEDVRNTVSEAHAALRQILSDFRAPDAAKAGGLLPGLRELALDFTRRSDIPVDISALQDEPALSLQAQAQALLVAKEALANVARHAGARHVQMGLRLHAGQWQLQVEDDGCGPGLPDPAGNHYGIDIMKARAQRLGGQLTLEARTGGGTCVRLVFPPPQSMSNGDRTR